MIEEMVPLKKRPIKYRTKGLYLYRFDEFCSLSIGWNASVIYASIITVPVG